MSSSLINLQAVELHRLTLASLALVNAYSGWRALERRTGVDRLN